MLENMDNLFLQAKVFVFVASLLVVIANAYQLIKVMVTESGKFETTNAGKAIFVAALSYVVTSIVSMFI